ncbi:hypothetical protein MF672_017175 [Actinomadura sp. ATCC 31491]|uniref:Uncharacterized protein n=1 Tax=Actinomadura luzonensis TaxID=2805427 RepID=A0ABT0FUC8_9ACTN|nr:hypothetical protein [Actinomadura luzonensis]MCK2215506.1 hypothetical protein [Actinomadura luzonensis]
MTTGERRPPAPPAPRPGLWRRILIIAALAAVILAAAALGAASFLLIS